jgi:AcrR family transcriptional regulator
MAVDVGLRERKKQETAKRISGTAVSLFLQRGYDNVSIAEVAAESDVSKMTVFNYFPRKEDLVLAGPAAHVDDTSRIVRERAPGESVVAALRRVYLEELAQRAPQTGLRSDLTKIVQLIMTTPALATGYREMVGWGEGALAATLARETGAKEGDIVPHVAARQIIAIRQVLIEDNFRRIAAGESADEIYPSAVAAAEQAFAMLASGLGDYCIRPTKKH